MSADAWLRHAAALRTLAAALAVDGEGDDLVQEAWLRTRRIADTNAPRGWWSAVLRNLARDSARAHSRREASERVAARPERMPSEAEVLERLEIAQRVAAEVARLDEPYRTAIHLRYFEGLGPEEIAQRSNAPLETIRARLRRGLEKLRERMDRSCGGDRSQWSIALAAIAMRSDRALTSSAAGSLTWIGGVVMSTKIAVGVAAGLVAGLAVFMLWSNRESAQPRPDVVEAAPSEVVAALREPAAKVEPAQPTRIEHTASDPTPAASPAVEDDSFEVRGSVVIVDEQGIEHPSESGALDIVYGKTERDAHRQELAFEHGAWSVRIPKESFFAVFKLVANGREALLPKSRPMRPTGAEPLEIRGRWLARGRLRVIDGVTKQDLHDVELRYADSWRANPEWTHPGDYTGMTALHFASSPLQLPDRLRSTPYWVHVAGYAWARVQFDPTTDTERTAELVAPASVDVSASGGAIPSDACVRLYATKQISYAFEASVSVHAAAAGSTRIDDLAPGTYTACIEVGGDDSRQRLGETQVELIAHQIANATVPIDASQLEQPTVHLFGTLALPNGTPVEATQLFLNCKEPGVKRVTLNAADMTPVGGNEHLRKWDAGAVRTGVWGAQIKPAFYRQAIHAESPGELEVDIVVPELVRVAVDVSDAATGAPLAPDRISWHDMPAEEVGSFFVSEMTSLGEKGHYEFSAPSAPARVSCVLDGYVPYDESIDLRQHEPVMHIRLDRASGVHLQVFDGPERLRVAFDFFDRVRLTLPGERRPLGRPGSTDTEFEWTRVLGPGKYEVHFPALDGYEQLETITVDVPAGQVIDVVAHAVRKH